MHATAEFLRKSIKAIKTCFFFFFFFRICDLWSGDRWTQVFGEGDVQQKGKIQTFWYAGRLPLILFLSGESWSTHKKNSEDGAWSTYCNDFEKKKWEYFLSNKWIFSKLKDKKREDKFFDIAFNLLKIIHPFQGKKHYWNLNCKSQEDLITY